MPRAKPKNKANGKGLRSAQFEVNVSADNMDVQQTSSQPRAAARRSREIPDSQEHPDDAGLSDSDQAADLGGYDTEEDETPADVKRAIVSGTPAATKKVVYVSMVPCCFHNMPSFSVAVDMYGYRPVSCHRVQSRSIPASWYLMACSLLISFADSQGKRNWLQRSFGS